MNNCSHGANQTNCVECGNCVYCVIETFDESTCACSMCRMLAPSVKLVMKSMKDNFGISTDEIINEVETIARKRIEEDKIDRSKLN